MKIWHAPQKAGKYANIGGYSGILIGTMLGLIGYLVANPAYAAPLFVVSPILIAIGTLATFWASGIQTIHSDHSIAAANAAAADANERAYRLDLEAERLRNHLAGRRLTEKQSMTLTDVFGETRPSARIWLQVRGEDSEARRYWFDIAEALDASGIHISRMTMSEYVGVGMVVGGGAQSDREIIVNAFGKAGIEIFEDQSGNVNLLILAILSKPPL